MRLPAPERRRGISGGVLGGPDGSLLLLPRALLVPLAGSLPAHRDLLWRTEHLPSARRGLLVFFGALYAIRGFGVLSWFLAPGALAAALLAGFAMMWLPMLNEVAVLGFMLLTLAAFGLGLGDTWADWRSRARPTT